MYEYFTYDSTNNIPLNNPFEVLNRDTNESIMSFENEVPQTSSHENIQSHSPRKRWKDPSKQSIIIAGDSIVKSIHQNKTCRDNQVKVRSVPGATTEDFQDYVKPLIREQPSCLILHVGTNNLRSEEPESTAEKILSVKGLVIKLSPRTEVIISSLTTRTDRMELHQKVKEVNNILFSYNLNIIDN